MSAASVIKGKKTEFLCILIVIACVENINIDCILKEYFTNVYIASHSDRFTYYSEPKRTLRSKIVKMITLWQDNQNLIVMSGVAIAVFFNCLYERYLNSNVY